MSCKLQKVLRLRPDVVAMRSTGFTAPPPCLQEACFGASAAKAMAGSPVSSAGGLDGPGHLLPLPSSKHYRRSPCCCCRSLLPLAAAARCCPPSLQPQHCRPGDRRCGGRAQVCQPAAAGGASGSQPRVQVRAVVIQRVLMQIAKPLCCPLLLAPFFLRDALLWLLAVTARCLLPTVLQAARRCPGSAQLPAAPAGPRRQPVLCLACAPQLGVSHACHG